MKLSLDQLEAEDPSDLEPCELDLGDGVVVTLPHPMDVPFANLVDFDPTNPTVVLRTLMGADAFEKFISNPRVTGRRLEQIFTLYQEHYGLGDVGEGSASPTRSCGTARRSKPTSALQWKGKGV